MSAAEEKTLDQKFSENIKLTSQEIKDWPSWKQQLLGKRIQSEDKKK